jgi:(S)-2-hydroxyglutarate dehydrogenase
MSLTAFAPSQRRYDVIIVGGGLVGLATARTLLLRQPKTRLLLLEKEPALVAHQSGHNSGVIHTGIYYAPGSLKAKLCVAGYHALLEYCLIKQIPYDLCGKLIVALNQDELPRLQTLMDRGTANGVGNLRFVSQDELREIEPFATGIKAIHSPNTGIVDYMQVAGHYAQDIAEMGGELVVNTAVASLWPEGERVRLMLRTNHRSGYEGLLEAKTVIACAGLHSDRLAQPANTGNGAKTSPPAVQIVPFRGDYYLLRPEKAHMTRGMIYPVPDPRFPFLGVHYTRRMNGEVWVGPNAVLAFAREGYKRFDINFRDLAEVLRFPGFWRLAEKYWQMGAAEMYRDYVKSAYYADARRYMPALQPDDLIAGPSGVRAQALRSDGTLVDDFLISRQGNLFHVQNAPSPAATSSLMIGQYIVDQVLGTAGANT